MEWSIVAEQYFQCSIVELSQKDWREFLKLLKGWYEADSRPLPWKGLDNAYLVWVSEVFLQQTQADRVVEYWLRFTAKFPTVEDLAAATFEEALPYFKGLGFYGRLRRMLLTAQAVCANSTSNPTTSLGAGSLYSKKITKSNIQNSKKMKEKESDEDFRPRFPKNVDELERLPGIGPYTARAIASFAYGQQVLAPDTNVVRVLSRYMGKGFPAKNVHGNLNDQVPMSKVKAQQSKWVMKQLDFFDEHYPEDLNLNQALMDLGAKVCSARKPSCERCPLIKNCAYGRDPDQFEQLKMKAKDKMKIVGNPRSLRGYQKIVVGVLIDGVNKRVLVSRRKADQSFAGLLEFPGGKVEEGEDLRAAMQREFREEVGVEVSVRPPFDKMALHRQKLLLHFHRCRILSGEIQKKESDEDLRGHEGQELMWIDQQDLDPQQFLPANKKIIEALKKSRL